MSVFVSAVDDLFVDPNLALDAVYRAGGTGPDVPVRVMLRRPDRIGDFGETRIVAGTVMIDVRVSEVARPAESDTFEIVDDVFAVQGAPLRDAECLVWTLEVRPA